MFVELRLEVVSTGRVPARTISGLSRQTGEVTESLLCVDALIDKEVSPTFEVERESLLFEHHRKRTSTLSDRGCLREVLLFEHVIEHQRDVQRDDGVFGRVANLIRCEVAGSVKARLHCAFAVE